MADRHAYRAAETLETDVIAEAREIGRELMPGFVPTAEMQFLEKNDFIELLAKTYSGNENEAYRTFVKYGTVGLFDHASNKAFVTFTERAPSYRAALVHTVHEREGHAYMRGMNALKEHRELFEKMQRRKVTATPVEEDVVPIWGEPSKKITYRGADGAIQMLELEKSRTSDEVSERDLVNATLAREVIQFFDEGFAYWTTVKAVERVKSDKKRFSKYGQTRINAWSPLERDSRSIDEESKPEKYMNDRYRHNSWNGLVFYSEIEKRFGEAAVPLAAKACLDVPLKELVDGELASLYVTNVVYDDYDLAGNIADKATSKYAARKLAELSAILKPVENERYKHSLLAEIIGKGVDSLIFRPEEPVGEPKNSGLSSKTG